MPKSNVSSPCRIASPSVAKHECADCGIKLTRPSHLARHQNSHLPAHQRRHLPCPLCSASFSRNDVLLRHLRITHKSQASPRRSSQKSCHRCIEKKLKCNRGEPCQRCAKAGVPCGYAVGPRSSAGELELQGEGSSYNQQSGHESSADGMPAGRDMAPEWTALVSPQETACSGDTGGVDCEASECMVTPVGMGIEDGDTGSDTLRNDSLVGNTFSYLDQYGVESSAPRPAPDTSYTDLNEALFFRPSDQSSTNFTMWGSEFNNINLDWLDFGTASSVDVPDDSPLASEVAPLLMRQSQPPGGSHAELLMNAHDGKSQEASSDAQQWPFGQTRDSVPQKYKLPPLHDVLYGAFAPSNLSQNSDALVRILSRAYLPKFDDVQDHATLVAMKTLERSLNAFLNEFNPILPIVHVPTWSMDDCPTVLLAAMASIGAIFADEPGAAAYSQLLSDICNQMITWLGGSDSTNYHDLAYLSASCLHQIYSLGSGNRQLYQNADRSRGMLMGSLRGMSLLGTQLILGQTRPGLAKASPTADASTLYNDWMRWKKEEQEIRVVWASFEYDCTLSTLTNRRGAVDLAELPTRLPCPEAVWGAPSAQAWNALRTHHSDRTMNASLPEALQKTLAAGVAPEQNADLTPWGKRLCAQVIGRLLWDLKQLQIMSMSDFLGMTSLFAAQRQTKSALLRGLDKLADSMNTPGSISELINYNITGLICHYNYLCTAEDVMDLVVFITRSSMEPRANRFQYPELDVGLAERRLESLFKADLAQTRSLAWHAAQIIAVANTYTVSAPCEILRIFMGYAFILAVAKYCPEICASSVSSRAPSPGAAVQLDSSAPDDVQKKIIVEWIRYGGPASIATCSDLCTPVGMKCVSEHAQALLQRMRFWGLAEKLKRVLESFHSKA